MPKRASLLTTLLLLGSMAGGCQCEEPAPSWPVDPAPGHVRLVEAARPEGGTEPTASASDLSVPPREGDVGWWVDLALGPQDLPHLAYTDAFEGELHYAAPEGDAWRVTAVDHAGAVGKYPALALDAEGRPHVLYYNQDKQRLMYATWVGPERVDPEDRRRPSGAAPGWLFEVVDEGEEIGMASTLTADEDGTLHAFYYDIQENLIHAWRDPSPPGEHVRWKRRIVDDYAGGSHSITIGYARGADGTRWLSYAHYTMFDAELRVAWLPPGAEAWETEAITKEGNAGWKSGLVLDDDGQPLIAYLALKERQIRLARPDPAGEGWRISALADDANTLDFARGPGGLLLLAYEHLPGASLAGATVRYLTRPGTGGDLSDGWTLHPLPRSRMSGYLSATVGEDGPWIAWYDGTIRGVRLYGERPLADEMDAPAEAPSAAPSAPEADADAPSGDG